MSGVTPGIHRAIAVAAALLVLAGCTAAPAPSPTPTSDPSAIATDCRALINALNDSIHEMAQISPEQIAADPEGALDVLDGTIDAIEAAGQAASTPEIQKAAADTVTIMRDYSATLRRTGGNPSEDDKIVIQAQTALVQDQLGIVGGLCN